MGGVVSAIGDTFTGVIGALTGKSQADAAETIANATSQAQKAALEQQQRLAQLQQQENNKANASAPEYMEDDFYDSYDDSTTKTSPLGVDSSEYSLGKNSLLGS